MTHAGRALSARMTRGAGPSGPARGGDGTLGPVRDWLGHGVVRDHQRRERASSSKTCVAFGPGLCNRHVIHAGTPLADLREAVACDSHAPGLRTSAALRYEDGAPMRPLPRSALLLAGLLAAG